MDSAYLKKAVGPVLAAGIAETICERPDDPIDYLAQFLLKSVADDQAGKAVTKQKKQATDAAAAADEAAAKKAADESGLAEAQAHQTEKEDKRLGSLLENATSSEEVFSAVLSCAL